MSRIIVLGGTFDPIHVGHISILEQVALALGADSARIVPVFRPPHRADAGASAQDRLDMARAAAADHPGIDVDDIEVRRGGNSYTIDSVGAWRQEMPAAELYLVLGADAARGIRLWHRADELLGMVRWVVVNRSQEPPLLSPELRRLGFPPAATRMLYVLSPPISATDIRRRCAAGLSIDGMVAPGVAAIIRQRGLYGVPRTSAGV